MAVGTSASEKVCMWVSLASSPFDRVLGWPPSMVGLNRCRSSHDGPEQDPDGCGYRHCKRSPKGDADYARHDMCAARTCCQSPKEREEDERGPGHDDNQDRLRG